MNPINTFIYLKRELERLVFKKIHVYTMIFKTGVTETHT